MRYDRVLSKYAFTSRAISTIANTKASVVFTTEFMLPTLMMVRRLEEAYIL